MLGGADDAAGAVLDGADDAAAPAAMAFSALSSLRSEVTRRVALRSDANV